MVQWRTASSYCFCGEFDKGGILAVHRQFEEVLSICYNSRSSGAVLELYAASLIQKRLRQIFAKLYKQLHSVAKFVFALPLGFVYLLGLYIYFFFFN